ncbi:MAG: class I SAM-dependent methyltransferase [Chloroflexi bacterium]|nr:class I SAM-dependent methyltransferase [Chloroflexota bacterium]
MTSYLGKHAEYYDIIYKEKPYAQEAAFVQACIKRYGHGETQRLLELACGSGNHAFQLEQLGYSVLATDYSLDLLDVARKKAAQRASSVDFQLADMRTLELESPSFDAAICLFDSIGYVQTDAAIASVLSGVHRHLRPDGLIIFEFWHAPAMLSHYDPLRVRRWPMPNGELLRIATTQLLDQGNLAEVNYQIFELRDDHTYATLTETQVNRFFTVSEMDAFLRAADFRALDWLNGYTWDQELNDQTWHVLAVAQRA